PSAGAKSVAMYSSKTLPELWGEPEEELLEPAGRRTPCEQQTVKPRHTTTSRIPFKEKQTTMVLIFTIKRDSLGRTAVRRSNSGYEEWASASCRKFSNRTRPSRDSFWCSQRVRLLFQSSKDFSR